jgi:hypothetical protein
VKSDSRTGDREWREEATILRGELEVRTCVGVSQCTSRAGRQLLLLGIEEALEWAAIFFCRVL